MRQSLADLIKEIYADTKIIWEAAEGGEHPNAKFFNSWKRAVADSTGKYADLKAMLKVADAPEASPSAPQGQGPNGQALDVPPRNTKEATEGHGMEFGKPVKGSGNRMFFMGNGGPKDTGNMGVDKFKEFIEYWMKKEAEGESPEASEPGEGEFNTMDGYKDSQGNPLPEKDAEVSEEQTREWELEQSTNQTKEHMNLAKDQAIKVVNDMVEGGQMDAKDAPAWITNIKKTFADGERYVEGKLFKLLTVAHLADIDPDDPNFEQELHDATMRSQAGMRDYLTEFSADLKAYISMASGKDDLKPEDLTKDQKRAADRFILKSNGGQLYYKHEDPKYASIVGAYAGTGNYNALGISTPTGALNKMARSLVKQGVIVKGRSNDPGPAARQLTGDVLEHALAMATNCSKLEGDALLKCRKKNIDKVIAGIRGSTKWQAMKEAVDQGHGKIEGGVEGLGNCFETADAEAVKELLDMVEEDLGLEPGTGELEHLAVYFTVASAKGLEEAGEVLAEVCPGIELEQLGTGEKGINDEGTRTNVDAGGKCGGDMEALRRALAEHTGEGDEKFSQCAKQSKNLNASVKSRQGKNANTSELGKGSRGGSSPEGRAANIQNGGDYMRCIGEKSGHSPKEVEVETRKMQEAMAKEDKDVETVMNAIDELDNASIDGILKKLQGEIGGTDLASLEIIKGMRDDFKCAANKNIHKLKQKACRARAEAAYTQVRRVSKMGTSEGRRLYAGNVLRMQATEDSINLGIDLRNGLNNMEVSMGNEQQISGKLAESLLFGDPAPTQENFHITKDGITYTPPKEHGVHDGPSVTLESRVKAERCSTMVKTHEAYQSKQKVPISKLKGSIAKQAEAIKKEKAAKEKEEAESLTDVQRALGLVQKIIEKTKNRQA